ncbi:MAG: hypothetical protein KA163_12460 [Bacteroidia bacterium]|nr:hypothetical protein [Bacteroidia bacterium]
MKNLILILILVGSLSFSCRKKEKEATPTTPAFVSDSPYTISTATVYSGIFTSSTNTTIITPTSSVINNGSIAFFSNTVVPSMDWGSSVTVSNISSNNNVLNYDPVNYYYVNSALVNLNNEVWQVQGSNGIPSFKYTSDNNAPDCTSFNSIPDSISLSAGFTININNVVNCLPGASDISVGCLSQFLINKPLNNGNNVITYTPAELSALTPDNTGVAIILLEERKVVNIYGKDFQFVRVNRLVKSIKVKP